MAIDHVIPELDRKGLRDFGLTFGVIVVYLAYRIVVGDAPESPRTFVAFPGRAGAGALALMRGQRRRIDTDGS